MKKLIMLSVVVLLIAAVPASAQPPWDFCLVDFNYSPELQISKVGNVLHGQAVLAGDPSFPAPITGYVKGGVINITISYLLETGVRGYNIKTSGLEGTTWGVLNADASFYDLEHSAGWSKCPPVPDERVGASGAAD